MSKIAFVFPGQGSQEVGMGREIASDNFVADTIFNKADSVLGNELKKLCFEGPDEELKQTYNTQPALLTTSIALYAAGKELLPTPDYVAGHSLGEYTALVVAGAMSFGDAVEVVHKRGQYMNDAVPSGVGAMAAVMGTDRELIQVVCETVTASGLPVQIANINCPGQIVISGVKEGVTEATRLLKDKGTRRVINLPVSGPFHSTLMVTAAEKLEEKLESIHMKEATIPVFSNVDATSRTSASEIKYSLISQVCSSVLWEDSIRNMIDEGVDTFVEIGSGKVLTGLIKKIDKTVAVYNIHDSESLAGVSEKLKEVRA